MYSLQKVLRPIDYEQSLVFGKKKKKKKSEKKKIEASAPRGTLGIRCTESRSHLESSS